MALSTVQLRRVLWISTLWLVLACQPVWAGICRVTTTGSQFNDGSSWAEATNLQQALQVSGICTEIWVAKGIYKPGTDVRSSFGIAPDIGVYGGFFGNETSRAQRDPAAHLTVLSGDIDNNDGVDANGVDVDTTHIVGSNSYQVVYMQGVNANTVLDGFTITGGNAIGTSSTLGTGGGLYCFGGIGGLSCSPTLSNLVFSGNHAYSGGAVNLDGSHGGASSPSFHNVAFVGNAADFGGAVNTSGMFGVANPTFYNVTFSGNLANYGGAIYFSGGDNSSPSLTNVTFTGNRALEQGGAIFLNFSNDSTLTLRNSILWDDRVPLGQFGPEIAFVQCKVLIDHSIVQGSGGSGSGWNPNVGIDGGGNLDADPRLAALAYNRGTTPTLLPGTGSPVIDAGNDSGCPASDQRDLVRPQGTHCDIGAVETFSVDLIGHKGYEACWSKALTKASFLGRIQSAIDGATTCVAPFAIGSFVVCNTLSCPGAALGCPVTTHASAFTDGGNFGVGKFNAGGSFDTLNIPVNGVSGGCTVTAFIAGDWVPEYVFSDDGNFGDYAVLLNRLGLALTTFGAVGNTLDCQNYGNVFAGQVLGQTQTALAKKVRDATVGQSVCPVSP